MPKLFKKFDTDNNGELELEEFVVPRQHCKLPSALRVP